LRTVQRIPAFTVLYSATSPTEAEKASQVTA
jgi:hypothetical protein